MQVKHVNKEVCESCLNKLKDCHPYLSEWFLPLKKEFLDLHISWGYRGKEDQELFFSEGRTTCHYPNSPHNKTKDGKPHSLALDLFQQVNGQTVYDKIFFSTLYARCKKQGQDIICGIDFKSLGDSNHFQYHEKI